MNPPSNLQGKQKKNDFGFEYELYNQLTWTPSPSPEIIGYFIYRDGKKIASVDASTHTYQDHDRKKGVSYTYAVTAFNSAGIESSPVTYRHQPQLKDTINRSKINSFVLQAISSTYCFEESLLVELNARNQPCCYSQPLVEVKTGYFFFTNSKMRKVYDRGGLDVQLCASYPLWNLNCRWTLNAYGAVEYFHRSGKSINEHQKTSLWSVPVNIGFKPVYAIND